MGGFESETREWVRKAQKRVSELSTLPPEERDRSVHAFAASAAEYAALCTLLSGEFVEAVDWFATAAEQYELDALKRPEEDVSVSVLHTSPHPFQRGLYCALVGGDSMLGEEIATDILGFDRTFSYAVEHTGEKVTVEAEPDRYHHMRVMAGGVLDEPRVVNESAAALHGELDQINELSGRQKRYGFEADILGAILSDDASQVMEKLTDVLELHRAGIQDPSELTADEAVCLEATGLVILARQYGLEVTVDSEFVPSEYVSFVLDRRL